MVKCSYCGSENADEEIFCEECGRPLKKPEKKKKVQKKYSTDENGNMVYFSEISVPHYLGLEEVLLFPERQMYKDEKYQLVFPQGTGKNLAEYLADSDYCSPQRYIDIESRILRILEAVQKEGFIVGSCDLEDFYLMNACLETMVLRVVRPLLVRSGIPKGYTAGEFSAPEVKNCNLEYIEKRTDVYLAGIIFNRMIIGGRYTAGNIDSQLFWGCNCTNAAFWPEGKKYRKFHHWLGRTLGMYPVSRLRNVKDCRYAFEKACVLEQSTLMSQLKIEDFLKTDVGKGKKEMMENSGRQADEWNEDAIEKWEKTVDGKKVTAYLLADGISNCDVGSGYQASNILRDNFKAVLEEKVDNSFEDVTYDIIEGLAHEIVRQSNRKIWEKACEYSSQEGSIMGSTFIFILIFEGVMYTYSLGDSPLYLIRRGNVIPLNCPDNCGYDALKNGMTYPEYRQMEGKGSISLYVGGEYARTESSYYKDREVDVVLLQENDIIIAASDGIIDYLGTKFSDTVWDKEALLVDLLSKKEPIDMRASHIISRDNKNGGGDNLSLILIYVA